MHADGAKPSTQWAGRWSPAPPRPLVALREARRTQGETG